MTDSSHQLDLANETKTAARAPRLGSEFNAFLFSPIGEGRNGMPLSVVSRRYASVGAQTGRRKHGMFDPPDSPGDNQRALSNPEGTLYARI